MFIQKVFLKINGRIFHENAWSYRSATVKSKQNRFSIVSAARRVQDVSVIVSNMAFCGSQPVGVGHVIREEIEIGDFKRRARMAPPGRKSQNQGLSDSAHQCLVSLCQVST